MGQSQYFIPNWPALSQFTSGFWTGLTQGGAATAMIAALPTPNTTPADLAVNAATGTLTPSQKSYLQQQEQAQLIQAGADPGTAAATAQTDVTAALIQAGADPSQNPLAPAGAIPWYIWAGALAIGGFALVGLLRK